MMIVIVTIGRANGAHCWAASHDVIVAAQAPSAPSRGSAHLLPHHGPSSIDGGDCGALFRAVPRDILRVYEVTKGAGKAHLLGNDGFSDGRQKELWHLAGFSG